MKVRAQFIDKLVSLMRTGGVLSALLILCATFLPQSIFAAHAESAALTIRVGPKDIWPPASITDLEAIPSSINEGELLLLWTAPYEDYVNPIAQDPVKEYFVRYATFSVLGVAGDTTAWWNNAADAVGEPFPPQQRGKSESFILTGLEPGATLYFAIKSRDEFLTNISTLDARAPTTSQAKALILDLPPPVVTGLSISPSSTSLTLSWNASTAADVANYRIYWDTLEPPDAFIATVTVPVGTTFYTFENLTGGNTYFFYVTALDKGQPTFLGQVLESTPSAIVSDYPRAIPLAVPAAPSNFGAIAITTNSITWQWQDNANNESGFRVYTSTGGLLATMAQSNGTGGVVSFLENNLSPNLQYSRYVRAFNVVGESSNSNSSSRFTLANPPINSVLFNVKITSAGIAWVANNNPISTIYQVQVSTDSGFGIASDIKVTGLTTVVEDLASITTYYFRVRAQNGEGVATAYDTVLSSLTETNIAQGLVAVPGNRKVTLDWQDTFESAISGYFVYRSTNLSLPFVRLFVVPITTSAYEDTGLINGVTYYYRISIVNRFNRENPLSAVVSAARPRKLAAPNPPSGISGSLTGNIFKIKWHAPVLNVDGSTETELAGYRIFKSSGMEGPYHFWALLPATSNSWISPDPVPPTVWYLLRAFDTSDNESVNSMRISAEEAPVLTAAAADETMHVRFTGDDKKVTNSETNSLGEDILMSITRKDEEEKGNVLTSYEIKSFGAATKKEIKELRISKPTVELQFRYTQGVAGAYLPLTAKLPPLVSSVKDVGIFWHNSVEFVKFGGQVNETKGTISIKTARPLGRFQVRKVLRATEFTFSQLTPRKIFTPNGDGVNDEIILFVENPRESAITQAKIYDITGAEVADFEQGIVAGQQGIISLKWNGRDKNGETVRSGVYVYQVQAEGKVVNGTIVVAR